MSCADVLDRLSDYCDGELPPSERRELELHLEGCADCRAELAREREVIRLAANWRRDVESEHDLWPAIEAEIRTRRGRVSSARRPRVTSVGLAAAAALVAAVALVLVRWADTPDSSTTGMPAPAVETIGGPLSAGEPVLAKASERARVAGGVMHLREDLLRSIAERRARLAPETQALIDRNLRIIDRALGEVYVALEEHPDNRVLEQRLAAIHRHESGFLKQVSSL